ncbi:IS66 family transposase, partial [Aliiglaciecola sp.]|nr:IS66 family transposase [Aliiglaciecola sp.]
MKTTRISHLPAAEIDAEYARQSAENAQLKQQVAWFNRQYFGRKSEKVLIDNPDQQVLFTLAEQPKPHSDTSQTVKAHTRNNKRKNDNDVNDSGLRFSDEVPRQIIDVPCPELEGEEADNYEVIGIKETHRLAQQVGSYVVMTYRRKVVKEKGTDTFVTPPAPDNVLEGCYADVSLLAGLMVDKAVYHLPLHRQHQRMLDAGVTLSRSTLIHYVSKGIELLRPIAKAMLASMLSGQHLAMDEVPHKVGRIQAKGSAHRQMKQTYFWPIYGQDNEVAFTWSNSRSTQHAIEQLTGFNGTLLTDGYVAYTNAVNQLNQQGQVITHASCWAHSRRMFEKAQDIAPQDAKHALSLIQKLYQVEKHIREQPLSDHEKTAYRQQHSEPIVDTFFTWIDQQRQRLDLLPKHPLTKAILYVHERQAQLCVYLTHPKVSIDTNHLERALRVIPMGRKNHLFCWTELGAEQLGILHSLTVTCRLHNINPYTYLVDVLQRVSQYPASK